MYVCSDQSLVMYEIIYRNCQMLILAWFGDGMAKTFFFFFKVYCNNWLYIYKIYRPV